MGLNNLDYDSSIITAQSSYSGTPCKVISLLRQRASVSLVFGDLDW